MSQRDPKAPLTKQQSKVLDFIKAKISEQGAPPTRKEICKQFKWKSPHAATCHLLLIEKKGYIKLTPFISRGVRVL